MQCKYIKPIQREDVIREFEKENGIQFAPEYIDFVKKNNGGRPELNACVLKNGVEKVLNKFLSFNESDKDNIFKAKKRVEEDDRSLIPFASDPAGNYFGFKDENVVYYDHEEGTEIEIANSFSEFIESLT